MALPFVLPKKQVDEVIILNTPAAADSVLATGRITWLDEAGSVALKVKVSDIIGRKKEVYTAGTAHVVDVDVTGAVLVANGTYSLTISAPNVVVKETQAVYQTRTYTVSVDATPTVAELQALFIAAVNTDVYGTATASSQAGDIVRLTSDAVGYGQLVVTTNVTGVTVADQTAFVASIGSADEVSGFLLPSSTLTVGAAYTRYTVRYRKSVNHPGVNGLQAVKEATAYIYALEAGADYAAFCTAIDAQFGGTATAATYLGAPAL